MSYSPGSPPSSARSATEPPGRVLFLDDDPDRAARFLAENPHAVWVETVDDCLARLEEKWDEVHLDHDLGGERFVDCGRDDCGMAIVRWLCLESHPHLRETRFYVHSHNPGAANLMVMQMYAAGYRVEFRPFGAPSNASRTPAQVFGTSRSGTSQTPAWLRTLGHWFVELTRPLR